MPEAKLVQTEHGTVPEGDGWFVLNARDARWGSIEGLGSYVPFEGDEKFPELGLNINVLQPAERGAMYHAEGHQEGFLVLAGEGLALVEGEERPLRAWDYFHCPADTAHVVVGVGKGPFVYVAVGGRSKDPSRLVYPVDPVALAHDAGVAEETKSGKEAYARFGKYETGPYREGTLPDG
ncbi:MAG TPA: cupin domain-containing protein [Gaiellaceae bacterium]|jgi:uncharacterized cupin superfamily protein|nr:cupin domain-containing protein [Gaiellaceae bacterium]